MVKLNASTVFRSLMHKKKMTRTQGISSKLKTWVRIMMAMTPTDSHSSLKEILFLMITSLQSKSLLLVLTRRMNPLSSMPLSCATRREMHLRLQADVNARIPNTTGAETITRKMPLTANVNNLIDAPVQEMVTVNKT